MTQTRWILLESGRHGVKGICHMVAIDAYQASWVFAGAVILERGLLTDGYITLE
jgi:hypothetical protein